MEKTETTVTFRSSELDTLKLEFINEVLSVCNQVESKNTSATLRWGIDFVFKLLHHMTNERANGNVTNSLDIDFSFLSIDGIEKPIITVD